MTRDRRAGRPRLVPYAGSAKPREQILDVAARLFVDRGFEGTSTRELAEAVGIRQASVYYHFPSGKDEILAELLQRSVRPTVDKIEKLEILGAETDATPEVLLYLLVVLDVRTLAEAPRNTGALAGIPDVRRREVFDSFGSAREELEATYTRLGSQVMAHLGAGVASESEYLGRALLQMVEIVIGMRADGLRITPTIEAIVAGWCLRVCLADQTHIDEAAARAAELIGALE